MSILFISLMVLGWLAAETFEEQSFAHYVGVWVFFFGLVSTLVWIVK